MMVLKKFVLVGAEEGWSYDTGRVQKDRYRPIFSMAKEPRKGLKGVGNQFKTSTVQQAAVLLLARVACVVKNFSSVSYLSGQKTCAG